MTSRGAGGDQSHATKGERRARWRADWRLCAYFGSRGFGLNQGTEFIGDGQEHGLTGADGRAYTYTLHIRSDGTRRLNIWPTVWTGTIDNEVYDEAPHRPTVVKLTPGEKRKRAIYGLIGCMTKAFAGTHEESVRRYKVAEEILRCWPQFFLQPGTPPPKNDDAPCQGRRGTADLKEQQADSRFVNSPWLAITPCKQCHGYSVVAFWAGGPNVLH